MKEFISKSGKKIIIRPPKMEDVDELLDFVNGLVDEKALVLINEKQNRKDEEKYVKESLEKIESKVRVHYLAFDGNKLVGNSQVEKGRFRESHIGEFGISIVKDYRLDGVGGQLASYVINEAKRELEGVKLLTLNVYSENSPALGLYKKLGFKIFGELPGGVNYGERMVDRLQMYLEL